MLRGRRVGTFTTGLVLIIFGMLFIGHTLFPLINLSMIVSIWPIILVLLGIEIIVAYIINNEEKIKYDGGAIFLIIVLSFFSMGMAGMEFIINNFSQLKTIF